MADPVTVRAATPDDADAICAIYAHYVTAGVATFEVEPPTRDEILRRIDAVTAAGLPYLVATLDGAVAGYAYCAPWKTRPAYRFTVEDSVYVAPDALGRGVGGALLDGLIAWCGQVGVRQMIAVVVDADADGSLTLHRRRGFTDAGRLVRVGFKHDRWLDTILLQKSFD